MAFPENDLRDHKSGSPPIDLLRAVTGAVEDFRLKSGSFPQRKLTIVIHESAGLIRQVDVIPTSSMQGRFR